MISTLSQQARRGREGDLFYIFPISREVLRDPNLIGFLFGRGGGGGGGGGGLFFSTTEIFVFVSLSMP